MEVNTQAHQAVELANQTNTQVWFQTFKAAIKARTQKLNFNLWFNRTVYLLLSSAPVYAHAADNPMGTFIAKIIVLVAGAFAGICFLALIISIGKGMMGKAAWADLINTMGWCGAGALVCTSGAGIAAYFGWAGD